MSLSIIYTRAQLGVLAPLVTVEVHLANGLPGLSIVGLPETAVKESKDRVRSAILNAGFEFPARRITVNLAPADLPKCGGRFDLAIAIGIVVASGQVPDAGLSDMEFVGELALSGELRSVTGILPTTLACGKSRRTLVLPEQNCEEAALSDTGQLAGVRSLQHLCELLLGGSPLPLYQSEATGPDIKNGYADFSDVNGQYQAKRAMEVAAAGNHHVLLYGPPGTGKSMLASRLPGIMPPLTREESLEVATVHSVAGLMKQAGSWLDRPFRQPHHSASGAALVGGGSVPRPGEISLAHHGVLFLDELPEFERRVLEVMREPLESGEIVISRASGSLTFPARFLLVAAMNPCPCGYLGHPDIACTDSEIQIERYRGKLSGPLLDRFDLQVEVPAQKATVFTRPASEKAQEKAAEPSHVIRARVTGAREVQRQRGKMNALLSGRELERHCQLDRHAIQILEAAVSRLRMSARGIHKVMRVSRTIADLEGAAGVSARHLSEALGYRKFERSGRAK
ncbi:MAG: ATP-dependent protease [Proteobacteria bacterium]|nr:MAG: ATP-dependent protease [Pseudomonadota bacterium]